MDNLVCILTVLTAICMPSVWGMLCYNKPDGVYEMNCRSYTTCTGGNAETIYCDEGQAFDQAKKVCDNKWEVPPPCGTYRDCADKPDGFYVDMETKCSSYYVCTSGTFTGHSLCPAGLVYNVNQGVCDYSYNAPPPCGTNQTAVATQR